MLSTKQNQSYTGHYRSVAVVVGGVYFGIVGMFLAVPIAVIFKQILQEYIASTEHEEQEDEKAGDEKTKDE